MNIPKHLTQDLLATDIDVPMSSEYSTQAEIDPFDLESYVSKEIGDTGKGRELADRIKELIRFEASRKQYNDQYDFAKPDGIKRYCLDRLEEIRFINKVFHVPSGFVCIAAFIGFLSRLAYGNAFPTDQDDELFEQFVRQFFPNQYPKTDMYSVFRCGIVHAMSFYPQRSVEEADDKPSNQRFPELLITHEDEKNHLMRKNVSGRKITVLVASKLCSDLRDAIESMFVDDSCAKNAVKVMAWQPAIVGGATDKTTDASLSGFTRSNESI